MPKKGWEVTIQGTRHVVEFGLEESTGKKYVRVDNRLAGRPFTDENIDVPIFVGGEDWLVRVEGTNAKLERSATPHDLGVQLLTICQAGAKRIVITDEAILVIEAVDMNAVAAQATGGILGRLVYDVMKETAGSSSTAQPIRSLAKLSEEKKTVLGLVPADIAAAVDDLDARAETLVIPKYVVTRIDLSSDRMTLQTQKREAEGEKPIELRGLETRMSEIRNHLCAAEYPLPDEEIAKADDQARRERRTGARRRSATEPEPPPISSTPKAAAAASGVRRVIPTRILVSDLGKDPFLQALADEDVNRIRAFYPRIKQRRGFLIRFLLEEIRKRDWDVLYLHASWDDKGRIKETGSMISVRDLLVPCHEAGMRMVWLASANPVEPIRDAIEWASSLELSVIVASARTSSYFDLMEAFLSRLSRLTPLQQAWSEARATLSDDPAVERFGAGDYVFVPNI